MVIARCLQGLSAAAVWVVGLAIIVDNAPSERVGAAIGETTIGLTWGLITGPMVGGYIYDKFGYYGSFSIPAVLITLDVALRFVMLEKPSMFLRRIMPNLAVFLTMIDSSKQNKPERSLHPRHISPPSNIDDISNEQQTGMAHQSLMCQNSDAEQAPLLQSSSGPDEVTKTKQQKATILHLLLTPRLPVALLATLSMAMIFSSLETVLPLFTIETFGWSSSGAGLIFIALSVPSFAGVQIGKVVDHLGVRTVGTFSFLLGACGWGLMRFVTDNTIAHVVLLILLLFILGLSITTAEICAMIEVSQVVDDYEAENPGAFGDKSPIAQSYALFNMAFAGGQLLGPLIAGTIRVNAGWGVMTLVLAIASGATALLFAFLGGPQQKANEAEPETMAS
ncbi:unnamed protein product [Penicillium salamii]|nr:unnamed protein product [Penicillium salamii]